MCVATPLVCPLGTFKSVHRWIQYIVLVCAHVDLLLVNLGGNTTEVGVAYSELGIPQGSSCQVDEIWNGTTMGRSAVGGMSTKLRSHASLFVRLSDCSPHAV